jgi:hypothetical protein
MEISGQLYDGEGKAPTINWLEDRVGGKAGMDGRYEEKKILLSSHE